MIISSLVNNRTVKLLFIIHLIVCQISYAALLPNLSGESKKPGENSLIDNATDEPKEAYLAQNIENKSPENFSSFSRHTNFFILSDELSFHTKVLLIYLLDNFTTKFSNFVSKTNPRSPPTKLS
jgi:hypothetical protein